MIFHAMLLLGWKDFAVVFCIALVMIGAGALAVAAQTFTQ
jgi:Sec-independent protein translocase protein TatA